MRILFWILLGSIFMMRGYFLFRLRQSGEPIMPDRGAIDHEGKGLFAFRLVSWFLLMALLISYAFNFSWLESFNMTLADALRWTGFGLGLVSIAFWTWTQISLGEQWSPQLHLRQQHHLITSGPYAHIRHPMYTAIAGFGVGLALVAANWIFFALAVLVVMGLVLRIPREEKMLIEEFGDSYRHYMQHTGSWYPR